MAKSKKNKNKAKLNLTVRDEQRNKLEQMASLENRSVSNLIEVMADERWKRLAEQQGVAYAKTVAEAMKLKLDMDNPADREKLRRAVLDLVAGRKMPKIKTAWLNSLVLFLAGNKAIHLRLGAVLTAWHLGPPRCLMLNSVEVGFSVEVIQGHSRCIAGAPRPTHRTD